MICKTATYEAKPGKLKDVTTSIREFVSYVKENEPGTVFYRAWQDPKNPVRFVHVMAFKNVAAEKRHQNSPGCRKFVDALYPNTVNGVAFQDFTDVH